MFYSITFIASALAVFTQLGNALPTKRDAPSDADILNYALTLEHLEAAFYTEGLKKYSPADFANAGHPEFVYPRMTEIRDHEHTHVTFLTGALTAAGITPVQSCTYSFPHNNCDEFIALAAVLESVGTSAYSGAAQFISNKDYLTAAATILSVEARHDAWLSSAVSKENPWSTAFETPLGLRQVYTLAGPLIVSCPAANGSPPVTPFPALSVSSAKPGQSAVMTFDAPSSDKQLYCAFIQGFQKVFSRLGADKTCQFPDSLVGTFFVVVTNDNNDAGDSSTVAGPAMVNFPFNSAGMVIS